MLSIYGQDKVSNIVQSMASDWGNDKFAGNGTYSYINVGGTDESRERV